MPGSTARGGYPFPTTTDPDDVPVDLRRLADRSAEVNTLFSDVQLGDRLAASVDNRGTLYRNPQTGLFSWSTGTDWVSVNPPKVVRIPHTFVAAPDVLVAIDDTGFIPPFFVAAPPGQTVTLVGVRHGIRSGTSVTVNVQRNGQTVAGLGNVNVTTTNTSTMLNEKLALADLDRLQIVVSAVSAAPNTPKSMSFTLFLEYSV